MAAAPAVRSRLAVNLALFALVAALGLLAWYRPKSGEAETFQVSALEPARVVSMRIEKPGHEPVALERRQGEWFMASPWQARAHEARVERLLEILTLRARQRLPAEDLARFELDRPLATLLAGSETLAVGALNSVTRQQYLRAGNWVYLVDSRAVADLFAPAARLLSPRLLGPGESPVAFELDSVSLRQEGGRWQRSPAPAQPVSQDDFNRWVQEWRLAAALDVQRAGAAGPDPPREVEIALAGGRSIRLRVLQQEPALILLRMDEGLAYRFPREVGERLLAIPQ